MNERLTLSVIAKRAEDVFGIEPGSIHAKVRTPGVTRARQAAVWIAKMKLGYSYCQIGYYLAGRDHSTIIHAFEGASSKYMTDATFRAAIAAILGQAVLCPCCHQELVNAA